jgi:uncharacterized glyoxalase superfamily protein PhnB
LTAICWPNAAAGPERLTTRGVGICAPIGDRPWGHRDFTVFDPDGYHITIARPLDA